MSGRRRGAGFTLVEVLVTLLILGLLLTLLYGVLIATLDSKQKVEARSTREKYRSGIIRLFSQDLRGVYTYAVDEAPSPGPSRAAGTPPPPPTSLPKKESKDALPRIPGSFTGEDGGDIDSISFVTTRDHEGPKDEFGEEEPGAAFSMIHYVLQPGSESGLYTLFRGVGPYATGDEEGSDKAYQEVYDRIVQFNLEYLDETDWRNEWKSADLPRAIRLTLDFIVDVEEKDDDERPTVSAVFTIPSS